MTKRLTLTIFFLLLIPGLCFGAVEFDSNGDGAIDKTYLHEYLADLMDLSLSGGEILVVDSDGDIVSLDPPSSDSILKITSSGSVSWLDYSSWDTDESDDTAAGTSADTSGFDNNLNSTHDTSQKIFDWLDDWTVTGTDNQTASEVSTNETAFSGNLNSTATDVQKALEILDSGIDADTLYGSADLTVTNEPIQLQWGINANSTGSVVADTFPALSWEKNATVQELRITAASAVSITGSFYWANGTKIADVVLSSATSGTNDIVDVSVNNDDQWYYVTNATVSTEWLTGTADGVTR